MVVKIMDKIHIDDQTRQQLLAVQKDEITSHYTYLKISRIIKDPHNRKTVQRIAGEELKHYKTWKRYTQQEVQPERLKITFFYWVSRLFGLTFGIKLMEKGEVDAQKAYAGISNVIEEVEQVIEEEENHENELLDMLDEEGLKYAGSVVLGLNDALVELTGALAGLTFAFQNTKLIALAGLITGISASFSMAASEYLSTKSEGEEGQNPGKSALYTGVAYIFTVILLILPYFIIANYILCLVMTIVIAILIIAIFNYYISVARDLPFRRRFTEMAVISLGVAALSFVIGYLIRGVLGIDV